jgi:GNAT superfamily N-acetyltransferase
MVRRCSTSSLFHRFHGPGDGIAYTVAQLRRRDDIVFLAWEDDRCIGMGVLAGPSDLDLHLGVLVEDQRQRQGVGGALVTALVDEARRRAVQSIHADVMGEDHQLVMSLGRFGKTTARVESGIFSVNIDLCRSTSHSATFDAPR